jgi:hypothetical protein
LKTGRGESATRKRNGGNKPKGKSRLRQGSKSYRGSTRPLRRKRCRRSADHWKRERCRRSAEKLEEALEEALAD